jgi:hypothetical protein
VVKIAQEINSDADKTISLLDDKILNEVEFEGYLAQKQFIEQKCKKCINTDKMKKRDCDLLYGYKNPCCKQMDRFIEKETKEINKKLILDGLNRLLSYHESP